MKLAHYSVRTRDLETSQRFYTEVFGLRAGSRPPFRFPGAWLYATDDESKFGVVHLVGNGADDYLGARRAQDGLDHIAFAAEDWASQRARLKALGVPFEERTVPRLGLHQVFLSDPSGIVIELNFPAPTDKP